LSHPQPGTPEWHAQVQEPIIDPERPIVDPHHHLWRQNYGVDQLLADTGSGHAVTRTVFVECRSTYRTDGPEHLKPVGETEFVAEAAEQTRERGGAVIAGIVAHADLSRPDLEEILEVHRQAGRGLFRGIRDAGASARAGEPLMIPGRAPADLYAREEFRRGVRLLGRQGLTYDTWHYHYQNPDFAELARAVPDTTLVLDHFGTPLGVGSFAGRRDEIFETWKKDVAEIARCENVVAKLGGLAMPDNGFGWNTRATPATSDELVAAQSRYYLHMIECFGPERSMLEADPLLADRLPITELDHVGRLSVTVKIDALGC